MKAIIMAGGKGSRISSIASDIPKPMIRITGKPILEYQIDCLRRNGLTDITLVIGHLGHIIREYFGDGYKFNVKISYFVEPFPLGTAGALFRMSGLTEDFLLLCGDTIFDIDFTRLCSFHKKSYACSTLVSHPNGHPQDSSLLVTEIQPPAELGGIPQDSHKVIRWLNKEDNRGQFFYKNRVNAGIEIISPILLEKARKAIGTEKVDLDRDVLKPWVSAGYIYAYDTTEYIKDMGTPERYYQTESDLCSGLVKQRNLSRKQKAVFLDRDGTLNRDVGFLTEISSMELLPDVADAVRIINASGYLAIVVTNQPVIARGEITFEQLQAIHNKLETLLGIEGAYLDAIYFCPHHPHRGYEGERVEYKHVCSCRKPKPGMLLQAAEDFNIDLSLSYMVGDSVVDISAGRSAGCKTVRISDLYSLNSFAKEYLLSSS